MAYAQITKDPSDQIHFNQYFSAADKIPKAGIDRSAQGGAE